MVKVNEHMKNKFLSSKVDSRELKNWLSINLFISMMLLSLDPQHQCKILTEEHKSAIPAMVGQTALNPGGWLASQAPKPSALWES